MKTILLHIFLIVSTSCLAQRKPLSPLSGLPKNTRTNSVKFSLQKRISFYPFNKSSQIKIVSFGLQLDSNQRKDESNYKLPMLNDTICFSKIDEIKTLTLKQIDTLTDIMYNECSRWSITESHEAGCYFPRNAILFFDKNGKVFEYIEICFECSVIETSNPKITNPDLCSYMYRHLETFFNRIGIKTSAYQLRKNDN